MNTALNDAAFRLISHSLASQDQNNSSPRTEETLCDALSISFPEATADEISAAFVIARSLEDRAIAIAGTLRDGVKDSPVMQESLAKDCPGFSEMSYFWAVNDGFVLTRK